MHSHKQSHPYQKILPRSWKESCQDLFMNLARNQINFHMDLEQVSKIHASGIDLEQISCQFATCQILWLNLAKILQEIFNLQGMYGVTPKLST